MPVLDLDLVIIFVLGERYLIWLAVYGQLLDGTHIFLEKNGIKVNLDEQGRAEKDNHCTFWQFQNHLLQLP